MKIKINGTDFKLPAELNAALQAVLDAAKAAEEESQPEQKSPFARAGHGETYYYIRCTGGVEYDREYNACDDADCYAVANYCTDSALMEQRALHETLNRLLWRYSEEHGGDKQPWDGETPHCYVKRSIRGEISVGWGGLAKDQGKIYFPDDATAVAAIHDVEGGNA